MSEQAAHERATGQVAAEYDAHEVVMVEGRGYCEECHPGRGLQRHTDYALEQAGAQER